MVYLHCAERDTAPVRETNDVDAMLNAKDFPHILMQFTTALKKVGFTSAPGASMEGHHHRWLNDGAMVDVLIPRGLGDRTAQRKGADGGTTIQSPGGTQALMRSEPVDVFVAGRKARIYRPSILGAIVGKSAAYGITQDPKRERHLRDLAMLLSVLVPGDDMAGITKADRRYLNSAFAALDSRLDSYDIPDADLGLARMRSEVSKSEASDARARQESAARVRSQKRTTADVRSGGHCGVATAGNKPCRNPRGACPHHGSR